MDKQNQDKTAGEHEVESSANLKRSHVPSKACNIHEKTDEQPDNANNNGGSQASTSPPRKVLVAALKNKLEEEKKMGNIALAHEIAMDNSFRLPDPTEALDVAPEDNSPEANKKRFHKNVKEVVQRAFWDNVRVGIESDPPKYDHAFVLLHEIKDILLSLLPPNRVTSIHKRIHEVLDMELLQQQAQNDTLDVRLVAQFIINTMAALCAPARDDDIEALRSVEDIVDLFKRIYALLDQMKIDLANFTIQTVRPHIQQQQYEYERSSFAKLVQKSPDGLKKTRDWIVATYKEMDMTENKTPDKKTDSGEQSEKKSTPSPLSVLKIAYTKLLTWDYQRDDFPETLRMDEKRFEALQKQVEQITLVCSSIITSCGVFGQPLASHHVFLTKLKDVLFTLAAPESIKTTEIKDLLEKITLQLWKEATDYAAGKGSEVEKCVTTEKETILKSKITSLSLLQSHPVYSILHKRTIEYLRAVADTLAEHNSVTPPSFPAPPAGMSFIATDLINLSVQYAKLVNLNQTIYGPFYVPILREVLQIPQSPRDTAQNTTPSSENDEVKNGACRKLDMKDPSETKKAETDSSDSKGNQDETHEVTGSLADLD